MSLNSKKFDSAIWWKQYLGYGLDLAFVTLLVFPFIYNGYAGLAGKSMSLMVTGFVPIFNLLNADSLTQLDVINQFFFVCIYVAILIVMEIVTGGRSVGKYILGMKVVDATKGDRKPEAFQSFARNMLRLIPLNLFSCVANRPRGLHNYIARTAVVEVPSKVFKINIDSFVRSGLPNPKDINSLKDLYELKQKGAITEDEYNRLKNKILNR